MNEATILLCAVCVVLMGLLVYTHWFYSTQVKSLVDRLMARNLQEYETAKKPAPPRVVIKNELPTEDLGRIF